MNSLELCFNFISFVVFFLIFAVLFLRSCLSLMSGAWEWKPVKEDRSKKKFGVPFFFSSSMHYNRCAIEVHQWFMSVALMLVPFMTVSAYRVTDRGAASFLYTDTLLNILSFVWHPRRVKPVSISQTHLAALPNSRSASEVAMTSENEVTRSGNNQGDRGYWGMFDGGISFQSLCSRSLFEPDHHYRQPAHLKTGKCFFFLFHGRFSLLPIPFACEHVSNGHASVSWALFANACE